MTYQVPKTMGGQALPQRSLEGSMTAGSCEAGGSAPRDMVMVKEKVRLGRNCLHGIASVGPVGGV